MVANRVFCVVRDAVGMSGFTMNSDTPYVGLSLDVSAGPIVIELPPGALMGAVNDLHQRWVMDIGLPGPDHGAGGKHLLLPPGHAGEVPAGYYAATPKTNRVLGLIRALPPHGDLDAGIALMKSVKVYPLDGPGDGSDVEWGELSLSLDYSPGPFETEIRYWEMLHDLIDTEPPYDAYRNEYGNLAALGIAKGHPFAPDQRMTRILLQAAQIASAQMRVQSLADRRPDRVVWDGRQWEWAVLRPENGTFDADSYVDLEAREKWFYQAQIESPAMFARAPGAGSLYWLSARDSTGAYLDGALLPAQCPAPGPRQAVLVDHRLRRPDSHRDRHRSEPGRAAIPDRAHPRSPRRRPTRRTALQPPTTRWRAGQVDQDHPRPRLVCLLPHLRPRRPRVRSLLAATRLRAHSWRLTAPGSTSSPSFIDAAKTPASSPGRR